MRLLSLGAGVSKLLDVKSRISVFVGGKRRNTDVEDAS